MPFVQVAYRHSSTGQPSGLTPADVWQVAQRIRVQIREERLNRCLPVEAVIDRLTEIEVNGLQFEASWDLDHPVKNAAGKPVMGVTEYDVACPRCVMVSVNGPMLANAETLLRSTIAHEIGHVVFDAPGWLMTPPARPMFSSFSLSPKTRDPRELRANEFMGALLAPPSLLRVDLQRQAKRQRIPTAARPSNVISGAPAYDGRKLDRDAVEEIIFNLAESYGVSESFMRVRLDRYDLLRNRRDWWGLNEESFLHFGERVARELGGIFKVRGTEAILAAKGGGSATGLAMGSVTGRYGDNLMSWDISPTMGRPRHRRARARWYDQKAAKWNDVEVDIQDQGARATMGDRFSRADRTEAQGSANNGAKDSEREKGGGSATIDGNAAAKPGGFFILTGTRPGIDGAYRIEGVEHSYSRSGWTTKLDLKQPQAG